MTGEIGWHHPEDESDQWDGVNDPGIEHFRGSPLPHLARETNQNSMDGCRAEPVHVRFERAEVLAESIPGLEELRNTIEACAKAAVHESKKAEEFFERARQMLKSKKLAVLLVSDSNTTGVRGPCKNGAPFYAFMKAEGQSKKDSETAGGSYGIGKYAPYAVSALRTVLISTIYTRPDGVAEQLTQGKSVLMSHDIDGTRRRGTGFWGLRDRCQPLVNKFSLIPGWLRRAEGEDQLKDRLGTTLAILGFTG